MLAQSPAAWLDRIRGMSVAPANTRGSRAFAAASPVPRRQAKDQRQDGVPSGM